MNTEKQHSFGISSFVLKIIACVCMTIDHIGLLFIPYPAVLTVGPYYILRAIGRIAFPLFAFMAVEGVYHTKNIKVYLLRLLIGSLIVDGFGYVVSMITGMSIGSNPIIGNAFTDLFLGVLLVYLLKRKDKFSFLAILPFAYAFFTKVEINESWGTLFKADWGFFSICLFLMLFLGRELADFFMKKKALQDGLEEDAYLLLNANKYHKAMYSVMIILVGLIFYLIYRIDNTNFLLPPGYVPIGTYFVLSILFILLYNGKKGYSNKIIQYSFYVYYPLHFLILGIFSLFFGTLAGTF